MTHHVIVGSGIAALGAAESLRRAQPQARITMVSTEPLPFYSRPGLAYFLTREVPEAQLTIRTPDDLEALRLDYRTRRATLLFPDTHCLLLEDGERLSYDRLLLATGAASIPADFPGHALQGVLQLDGFDDARALLARAQDARAAVVIGGGSTALELVEGLHAQGVHTHYLMRGDRYWSRVLDTVESAIVESRLQHDGVVLHRNSAIREAMGSGGVVSGVTTTAGEHIACSIVAVAVGVRPRVELAQMAGLRVDRGIVTNEYLETSAVDVFAAGDAAQVYDPVTRIAKLDTLWNSALAQGRTAGLNMAGVRVAYRTRPALNVTRIGGITTTIIGAVGGTHDPDLLTITRGQSERWDGDPHAWSVGATRLGDRLRVMVSGRAIVGAIVMGDQRVSQPLAHLIGEEVDISALRPALDAAPDAAMDLLLSFCDAHIDDRAAHLG